MSDITAIDLDDVYDTSALETHHRVEFAKLANGKGYTSSRFVLKTLRTDLHEDEYTKGVVDLAIEAEFLSVLQHPNIIAMRAIANSDPHDSRFFVVLERLNQTLDRRFNYWRGVVGENTGYWFPVIGYCCANTNALHQVWKERISTALDIAKAVQFLHGKNIVYRDLVSRTRKMCKCRHRLERDHVVSRCFFMVGLETGQYWLQLARRLENL